jgi:flavin-binding protein dodecin
MANNVHAEAPATIRVIELVGVSDKSWSDAAQQAVERASETIRHVTGIDVLHSTGVVRGGKIVEYRVNLKVAFVVDREDLHFSPEGL